MSGTAQKIRERATIGLVSSIRDELSSSKEIGSSGDLSLNYGIVQLGLHLSTIRSTWAIAVVGCGAWWYIMSYIA